MGSIQVSGARRCFDHHGQAPRGEEIHAQFATVVNIKSAFENAGVLFLREASGLGYGVRLRDARRRSRKK